MSIEHARGPDRRSTSRRWRSCRPVRRRCASRASGTIDPSARGRDRTGLADGAAPTPATTTRPTATWRRSRPGPTRPTVIGSACYPLSEHPYRARPAGPDLPVLDGDDQRAARGRPAPRPDSALAAPPRRLRAGVAPGRTATTCTTCACRGRPIRRRGGTTSTSAAPRRRSSSSLPRWCTPASRSTTCTTG